MTGNRSYSGPRSDHFDGRRFFNPGQKPTGRSVRDLLRWRLARKLEPWPRSVPVSPVRPEPRVTDLRLIMVGHASVLIQAAGRNVLVDPVWSPRASPVGWAGPKRVAAPGIEFDALPPIDIVLLTHAHYDHLDLTTLRRLVDRFRPRIIAPLGNDAVIARAHPDMVVETYDWGETADLGGGGRVRLHPAIHWSARTLWDRDMALWCGYGIEFPVGTIYIAGDTGYGDGQPFRAVTQAHPRIDVAVLPIGAYEPRWFMHPQHVDPSEAVQIMLDCGAERALGIHWGTFALSDESRDAPPAALAAALERLGLSADRFVPFAPGDVWVKDAGLTRAA